MSTSRQWALVIAGAMLPIAAASQEVIGQDPRVPDLMRQIERQALIQTLESRLNTLEMHAARGRGPEPSLIAQANPDGRSPEVTIGSEARDTQQQARVQSKDLIYQTEHAPLFERKFTIDSGFSYSYYDRRRLALSGFLALDAIFLGTINLDQTKSSTLTWDTTVRYGITDRLSIDANVPLVYRNSSFFSGGAGGAATVVSEASKSSTGIGDVSVGIFYQLIKEAAGVPDVVASLRVRAPTGKAPFGIKLVQADATNTNLNIEESLPTGNGVWSGTFGMSFLKTYDPIVLFASLGYTYNKPQSFSDISSIQGVVTPGRVKLGDSINVGGGLAIALNDRTALSMAYSNVFARETKVTTSGGTQSVVGSKTNSATMTFGLNHVLTKNLSISASLAMGLTPDAPNYVFGMRFPYTF
jgi:hypothetical protein